MPVCKKLNVIKEKLIKGDKRTCRYGNNCKDKGLLVEECMERINVLENIVMFKSFGKTGKNHHHSKESKSQEIIKVWWIGGAGNSCHRDGESPECRIGRRSKF